MDRKTIMGILGWYGALATLTAFALISLDLIGAGGPCYILLNLTGGVALTVFTYSRRVRPSMVVNAVWSLAAAISLVLYLRERDVEIFYRINGAAGRNVWLDRFGVFSAEGLIVLMAVTLLVLALIPVWQSRQGICRVCRVFDLRYHHLDSVAGAAHAAVVAGLSAILSWVGNQAFSLLVLWRDRPFVSLTDVNQLVEASGKSFPSDHSTIAFAMAFSMLFFRPRWGLVFVAAAVAVAWGRVFCGVHFPADVVAGMAVGGLWAFLAKVFSVRLDLTGRVCRMYELVCHRILRF